MFLPLEIAFDIMLVYTVYCVSLACKTYIHEIKKEEERSTK